MNFAIPCFMQEISISNIDELFRLIDPADPTWKDWYFRGQSKASHQLKPSVWRRSEDKKINDLFLKFKQKFSKENIKIIRENFKKVNDIYNCKLNLDYLINWRIEFNFENYLLSNFYQKANNSGLEIPDRELKTSHKKGDQYWLGNQFSERSLGLKEYKTSLDLKPEHPFTRHGRIVIFDPALPQHHGLPTRLLDWSGNIRKALFFCGLSSTENTRR